MKTDVQRTSRVSGASCYSEAAASGAPSQLTIEQVCGEPPCLVAAVSRCKCRSCVDGPDLRFRVCANSEHRRAAHAKHVVRFGQAPEWGTPEEQASEERERMAAELEAIRRCLGLEVNHAAGILDVVNAVAVRETQRDDAEQRERDLRAALRLVQHAPHAEIMRVLPGIVQRSDEARSALTKIEDLCGLIGDERAGVVAAVAAMREANVQSKRDRAALELERERREEAVKFHEMACKTIQDLELELRRLEAVASGARAASTTLDLLEELGKRLALVLHTDAARLGLVLGVFAELERTCRAFGEHPLTLAAIEAAAAAQNASANVGAKVPPEAPAKSRAQRSRELGIAAPRCVHAGPDADRYHSDCEDCREWRAAEERAKQAAWVAKGSPP